MTFAQSEMQTPLSRNSYVYFHFLENLHIVNVPIHIFHSLLVGRKNLTGYLFKPIVIVVMSNDY